MKLTETKKIVKKLLNERPETRDSDNILILEVLNYIEPGIEFKPFNQVIAQCSEQGKFPTFETIRRTRQKIQSENPNLRASSDVEGMRLIQEHKFFEFSLK